MTLDGQEWTENPWGDAAVSRDYDSYNMFSLGININLGSKSVEPLWWLNPLDWHMQKYAIQTDEIAETCIA
jgi:hypothetical protein